MLCRNVESFPPSYCFHPALYVIHIKTGFTQLDVYCYCYWPSKRIFLSSWMCLFYSANFIELFEIVHNEARVRVRQSTQKWRVSLYLQLLIILWSLGYFNFPFSKLKRAIWGRWRQSACPSTSNKAKVRGNSDSASSNLHGFVYSIKHISKSYWDGVHVHASVESEMKSSFEFCEWREFKWFICAIAIIHE